MPYYKEKRALSPLTSDVIRRERIERFLRMSANGFSTGVTSLMCSVRKEAIEDYKGFFIPQSLTFHYKGNNTPCFYICVFEDSLDARVTYPESKSPWTSSEPSIKQVEEHWQPLTDPVLIREMEDLFERVEAYAVKHHFSDFEGEDKLSAVKRHEVDISLLGSFCQMLGRGNTEVLDYIENHVIFAAFNPQNYLKQNDILNRMSIAECRDFSWKDTLTWDTSQFYESVLLCAMDWKGEAEDVSWNINEILKMIDPQNAETINMEDDGENSLTSYWLEQAAPLLAAMGWRIVFVDNIGDSYIFTLMESEKAEEFVRMGKSLGLDTSAL